MMLNQTVDMKTNNHWRFSCGMAKKTLFHKTEHIYWNMNPFLNKLSYCVFQ